VEVEAHDTPKSIESDQSQQMVSIEDSALQKSPTMSRQMSSTHRGKIPMRWLINVTGLNGSRTVADTFGYGSDSRHLQSYVFSSIQYHFDCKPQFLETVSGESCKDLDFVFSRKADSEADNSAWGSNHPSKYPFETSGFQPTWQTTSKNDFDSAPWETQHNEWGDEQMDWQSLGTAIDTSETINAMTPVFGPRSKTDILKTRIAIMLYEVESALLSHPEIDPHTLQTQLCRAKQIFTVPTLLRLIDTFFNRFCPHFPLFHAPSFNPLAVGLPYLFAVAISGAALTGEDAAASMARDMFDILDIYVYQLEVFTTDPPSDVATQGLHKSLQQLEELQCAYIVMVLQEWEGSLRSRIRTHKVRCKRVVEVRIIRIISCRVTYFANRLFERLAG
jgi:hypothetical protein